MLVDRHIAHAILTGHIQQHRLPVGPDGPTRMTPSRGRRLNIATARGLACTVEVTSCRRQEHLQSLTDTSLKALGHDTLEAWARRWLLERDSQWLMRRVPEDVGTLVTSDEELDAALDTLTDEQVLERFHQRWAVRTVWAVEFEVIQDPPLFLAQTGSVRYRKLPDGRWEVDTSEDHPDTDRGYTNRADQALMPAEAVDVDRLRPEWTRHALERHIAARKSADRARELANQLRAA
jgi:hypothetical protein